MTALSAVNELAVPWRGLGYGILCKFGLVLFSIVFALGVFIIPQQDNLRNVADVLCGVPATALTMP